MTERWQRYSPQLLSILRIVAAFVFIQNGTMKLFGFPAAMPGGGTAPPFTEIWFAGVLELVGGGLLLVGILTRPVAFLLSGEMAVAYFQAHAPQSPWTVVNGGTPAVLYCFLFLYFSAKGPGPWTLPALWHARPRPTHPAAHATPHLRA